ncbi:hypothetical protein KNU91_gp069 [Enterococcus phage nattely]|uniref:Uncharacterized protein n=1 Tax=Enterococcus phage nattely TaxID=2719593 RepID=A0A6G9LNF6_9CAUD|nr:hypothetical protein KNU91_gp069 [Enterococcus phage nattely]QIQ66236.1 hypothetical protein nattely_69 [Enterococcus phage nattely]
MLFRENERAQRLKNNHINLQGAIQDAGYDAQNMFPVMVQFKTNDGLWSKNEYCYLFDIQCGVKVILRDDIVVVQAKRPGNYEIARISKIPDDIVNNNNLMQKFIDIIEDGEHPLRVVVTNIQHHIDQYEKTERDKAEAEKLKMQLEEEFEKANKIALYEQLAENNPKFKEKLDRIKELGGL